jgi:hypothetical protein
LFRRVVTGQIGCKRECHHVKDARQTEATMKRRLFTPLLVVMLTFGLASPVVAHHRPGHGQDAVYLITMSTVGDRGISTDCGVEVTATEHRAGGLHLYAQDPVLNLVNTGVPVERRYPEGWEDSYPDDNGKPVFDGCVGAPDWNETDAYYPSSFFIYLERERNRGQLTHYVRFRWHFDRYFTDDVKENFTLTSRSIECDWPGYDTDKGITCTVDLAKGFDLRYYLNYTDTGQVDAPYVSMTDDERLDFKFELTIKKQPES